MGAAPAPLGPFFIVGHIKEQTNDRTTQTQAKPGRQSGAHAASAPLEGLTCLQSLKCHETGVSDLAPLKGLTNLQSLDCSNCQLAFVPEGFWFKPSLKYLFLHEAHIPGIPAEVLSQHQLWDNCLDSLRSHLRDLSAGSGRRCRTSCSWCSALG
jgi:hypothetical protein